MTQILEEILGGDSLTLPGAAKLLPGHRDNDTLDAATVWRWVTVGSKTTCGELVKLEAARIGGRWLTSRRAIGRFMESLTPEAAPSVKPKRTNAERRKSADAARKRLIQAGV